MGLTVEKDGTSAGSSWVAPPVSTHPTPVAKQLSYPSRVEVALCLRALGRVGLRGWTKNGVKWQSTDIAGRGRLVPKNPQKSPPCWQALPMPTKVGAARTFSAFPNGSITIL